MTNTATPGNIKITPCRDYGKMTEVWLASVRATHDFLSREDLEFYHLRLPSIYMPHVDLYAINGSDGDCCAFMGLSQDTIEMLFVHPHHMGKGYGSALLRFACEEKGILNVDVNEQNGQALKFYLQHGFCIVGRDDTDSEGKPYPILHLAKGQNSPGNRQSAISISIRTEEERDYRCVENLITQAFATAEHSDGNEAELIRKLRRSSAFIPELSLVAEIDNQIVGHILFTKIGIGGGEELALAPLAVRHEFQRQGIGSALIKEGHTVARGLGFRVTVVLGSPEYYPRHGYVPTSSLDIQAPFDGMDEYFMAYPLSEDAPIPQGMVRHDPAFGI